MTTRVLQIFGALQLGGAETLIVSALRHMDRSRFQVDFAVHRDAPAHYDAAVRALGSEIVVLPHAASAGPAAYARALGRVLRSGGYAAAHSHVQYWGGAVLAIARAGGVPVRVAHSHAPRDSAPDTPARAVYHRAMTALLCGSATHMLGCSRAALDGLFGRRGAAGRRAELLPNAIELARYRRPAGERREMRHALGVPEGAPLLLHVGRLSAAKNHTLLLDSFAALRARRPDAALLLAGEGELRGTIERRVAELGLAGAARLLGPRDDVPALLGAADLLLLPSLFEGLGMAAVEAQAAGLPALVSERIPPEADAGLGLLHTTPLAAGPAGWAAAMERLLALPPVPPWEQREAALARAGYDIHGLARRLEQIYSAASGG